MLSGPQIQPWTCFEGASTRSATAPPSYEYRYKSTAGGALQRYDPESPPPDVAKTTTDQGKTVPVHRPPGDAARSTATSTGSPLLYDPAKPWAPWAPQDGFNHKLVDHPRRELRHRATSRPTRPTC